VKNFTTRKLVRAGIVAGLYIGLTLIFLPFSFSGIQFRPAEGLTFLPIFFSDSVISLFVGCILVNLFSSFGILDIVIGSLTTLVASLLTRFIYKKTSSVFLALFPQVLLNAIFVPVIIYLSGMTEGYFINFVSIFISQLIFVYGIGLPLYYLFKKQQKNKTGLFKNED